MIPVNEPSLDGRELEYVSECVRTGWVSSEGRFIPAFEQAWAQYCGRRHGVAVSSGFAALQVAVSALQLQPGDEVIVPAFTIIACALAVIYSGGVPVFVDSDPETCALNASCIPACITPRTRAIMPVHLYGHPADMDPILSAAAKYKIAVIEDAAEAHGAEYLTNREGSDRQWRRCGSFGDMSVFSFYGNKLVTTGEGGMVLTDDDVLAARLRSLRNLCFQPERRFYHEALGYNFRMTNLQAALGVAQVERMDQIVARKRWIAQSYTDRLRGVPHLQLPEEKPWAKNIYWMYGLILDEGAGMGGDEFAQELAKEGIQTRPYFLGMHEQPVLQRQPWFRGGSFPVADRLARRGLYLPSGLALTEAQIDHVASGVRKVLGA